MNRRSFILGTTAAAAIARAQNAAPTVPTRRVYSLNRNWLFGGKMPAGTDAAGFDDAKFLRVTLPHTNVELPWHSFDDQRYEFVSIYRRVRWTIRARPAAFATATIRSCSKTFSP